MINLARWSLISSILLKTIATQPKGNYHVEYSVVSCPTVEVTVVQTQTVIQSGSTITDLKTSVVKSGVVITTAKSPTLAARNYAPSSANWKAPAWSQTSRMWHNPTWKFEVPCVASTVTKTIVEYTTSIVPDTIVSKTSVEVVPATTLYCREGCKLDVTATKLVYPQSVIHVTVPVTVDSMPKPHTPEALTWVFSGVTLTYPTTYLFYSELSHAYLAPTETAFATACPTASDSLTLASPTNYAPLIYPQEATPGPDLPPTALVEYLNGQQTVLVQLSGTPIGSSCDPVGGGIVEPVLVPQTGPPQVMYTSSYILAKTTSTTATLVAIVSGTTTSTSLSSRSSSLTAAASFATTGTSTVTLFSTSSTPTRSVVQVSVAEAWRSKPSSLEKSILAICGFVMAWL